MLERLAGGAADVERAHRELGARLADGLCSDDPNRLAQLDGKPGGQVASVALGANSSFGFAGERRADLELLETDLLERCGDFFVNDLAGLDDSFAGDGILDRLAARPPNDSR